MVLGMGLPLLTSASPLVASCPWLHKHTVVNLSLDAACTHCANAGGPGHVNSQPPPPMPMLARPCRQHTAAILLAGHGGQHTLGMHPKAKQIN